MMNDCNNYIGGKTFMPYVISFLAILAFILLWCYTVKRELDELKQGIDNSAVQVELNRNMMSNAKYGMELQQAEKMLNLSLVIYSETAKKFNSTVHKPFYRPVALLLGFKVVSEHI